MRLTRSDSASLCVLIVILLSWRPGLLRAEDAFTVPSNIARVLQQRCAECHGIDTAEGHVRFDMLTKLNKDERSDLLSKAQEQLFFERMPPEDAAKPDSTERKLLAEWLSQELHKLGRTTLEDKLRKPEYGNYVDHAGLFSGDYANLPGFTYDRRWLISEYIFNAKFQRILQDRSTARVHGKNVPVLGNHRFAQLSLTNPFLLPTRSGVRYYADTDLTGGHLSSMLTNAQKVSEHITGYLVKKNKGYVPAIHQIMALEDAHQTTLASRRQFLEMFIAKLCDDYYGSRNETLLPKFTPVQLKEVKELEAGEAYKKAPFHVAQNMLKNLDGEDFVYQALLSPQNQNKTDEELRELCERAWFYFGDHERTIQARMTILRDYLPEIRQHVKNDSRKLKLLAYKPLSDAEMEIIRASLEKHRQAGDHYQSLIEKCVKSWDQEFQRARMEAGPPSDKLLSELVDQLFVLILERAPETPEAEQYLSLSKTYVNKLGNLKAIQKLIQTLVLSSEFVYRQEMGVGVADQYGRRMLSPRDASYAIAYALTDQSPDKELAEAAASGRLCTKDDYKREVTRILKKRDAYYLVDKILADHNFQDNTTNTAIRKLRFFREFFGYPEAIAVFKDEKRFGSDRLSEATSRLLSEADRIVAYILERDQNVLEELLTTEEFYVYHDGDNGRMQSASDRIKRIYEHFKNLDWKNFKKEDLLDHKDFLKQVKMRGVDPDNLEARNRQGTTIQLFKLSMSTIAARLEKGQKEAAPFDFYRGYGSDFMPGENVGKFFNYSLDNWDYQTTQPAKVAHRKGMLTHPAWLIAHAKNTETDPVIRGKWVREKLLAGTIPEVPITVDAVIPEEHQQTLRERLSRATEAKYCWTCHRQMNPLGYAFEEYDDFGRFRREESLEYPENIVKKGPEEGNHLTERRDLYKTKPVNATGYLHGTGDDSLDGDVKDSADLIDRLGKSRRVRQSIIRHAFRYFLGRNESLSDSKTLIDAEKAYVENSGSFDAVIVSLLTSDSFVFRKAPEE